MGVERGEEGGGGLLMGMYVLYGLHDVAGDVWADVWFEVVGVVLW